MENTQIDTGASASMDNPVQADAAERAELSAVYQQMTRDNGSARGDDGKFAGDDEDHGSAGQDDGERGGGENGDEEGAAGQQSKPAAVAKPANWYGMDAEWDAIPGEHRARIAQEWNNLHRKMSDQGRQISEMEPVADVLNEYRELYEGKTLPNGDPATPDAAIAVLMSAHKKISANPILGLIEVADMYGVRQKLAQAIMAQPTQHSSQQERREAGLSPADVERLLETKLSQRDQERKFADEANSELSRLSKDKPLYAEIAEQDMVFAIEKARRRLGEDASKEDVFNLAYDMAVNADPDLRAKAAAALRKQAATDDPKRTADAKKANAINLTSTSTGKTRPLSEDDELRAAYRKSKEG